VTGIGGTSAGDSSNAPEDRSGYVRVGRWLCVAGAAVGALGLLGNVVGSQWLTTVVRGEPSMMPNTALGLLLIGAAGALRERKDVGRVRRTLALAAGVIVLVIGVGTLAEYLFGFDLHIDQLVMRGDRIEPVPGRPAPPTALALTCLGAALLLFDFRASARARPSEWLSVGAGLTALTALLGLAFRAELLYRSVRAPRVGVALPTAIALLLISMGFLLERPAGGVMRVITSPGPGGMQFRRLVFPAVLIPVLLGLTVTFLLGVVGRHELAFVVAVLVSMTIAVGTFGLAATAVPLNRVHDALESNRAWAQTLVEQAPDGVFVADLSGRYIDVNDAACRMLGFSREEILTKTVADLLRPEDAGRLSHTKSELLEGGIEKGEWDLLRKDGSYMPAEISAKIFPDGRWQGLVRDISDRKRLEAELRVAEGEQKFLSEFASALVSTIDHRETVEIVARHIAGKVADGCSLETLDEDGRLHQRVIAHRDPAKAAVCRRLEEMVFERPTVGAMVRAEKQPMLVHDATPAYLDTLGQNEEHRRLLRDLGPTSFIALPLIVHGGVVGSLVFFSTTASHRYVEKDLPFAEEVAMRAALAVEKARVHRIAQQAIGLRDDVLSIVAHDLRNPLGTILMQAELLRRRGAIDESASRKAGEVIGRSATRMNRLIQDLLDVARMEGGRLSIQRVPVPAHAVVADAAQAQATLAASAAVELRLDTTNELPEIWADRQRILQVFENLVGNAIKFTGPGGLITVGAEPTDGQVLFWVADTGAGIGADHLPHVFERLWQGRAGQKGAGLGLAIVKGIVEAHSGRVWVESTVGEGTTFFFTIPTAVRPPMQADQAPFP
jgi:PAS domain S-box-containing protein